MPLPALVPPGPPLTPAQVARGSRHLLLAEIGVDGQRRLRNARVLRRRGRAASGAPVLQYLAAAGVGTLGIVDDDVVDVSNLQRQVIHGTADVGRAKVDSARDAVAALDPDIRVVAHRDAADQRERRRDPARLRPRRRRDRQLPHPLPGQRRVRRASACRRCGGRCCGSTRRRPCSGAAHGVQLRDLFPTPPRADEVPSCAEAGVLGALCGQVGSVMATEVVKLVTGTGEPLLGRVLVDRRAARPVDRGPARRADPPPHRSARRPVDPGGPPHVRRPRHHRPRARPPARRPRGRHRRVPAHRRARARRVRARRPSPARCSCRWARCSTASALADLPRDQEIVVHCQVGARSLTAAQILRGAGFDASNLDGGILAWLDAPADRATTRRAPRGRPRAGRTAARDRGARSTRPTGWSWPTTCAPTSYLPRWDNSAMDGYAVRHADVAARPVDAAGGRGPRRRASADEPVVGPGTAARIMTGAPIPEGADAIVPVELTDAGHGDGRWSGRAAGRARTSAAPARTPCPVTSSSPRARCSGPRTSPPLASAGPRDRPGAPPPAGRRRLDRRRAGAARAAAAARPDPRLQLLAARGRRPRGRRGARADRAGARRPGGAARLCSLGLDGSTRSSPPAASASGAYDVVKAALARPAGRRVRRASPSSPASRRVSAGCPAAPRSTRCPATP